jgi:hypothetical protein
VAEVIGNPARRARSLPRDHELIYAPLQQQFFDVPAKGSG